MPGTRACQTAVGLISVQAVSLTLEKLNLFLALLLCNFTVSESLVMRILNLMATVNKSRDTFHSGSIVSTLYW
jgi:hypothetical protein